MKPEPPPYPRPVPDIDFDEDPILPGTIVYTNDDGGSEHERVAKRRRVEANAKAYLRGEGLFILSASLRGPFDAGWKNPWAAKNKKRAIGVESQAHPNKRARISPHSIKLAQGLDTIATFSKPRVPVSTQENPFARTIRSSEPPTHDEKVETWLRRNSALPQESFVVPTSPTPKKRSSVSGSAKIPKPTWTPTKQRITVNSQDIRAPLQYGSSRVPDSFDTIIPPGHHPAESHAKLQDALHDQDPVDSRHRASLSKDAREQPVRAEQAILNLKRKSEEPSHNDAGASVQTRGQSRKEDKSLRASRKPELTEESVQAPAEGNLLVPVSVPQDTSVRNVPAGSLAEPEVKLKELDASINEQLQNNQNIANDDRADDPEQPANHKMGNPLPSTAVSELQSTRLPPSAQHKPELQTSASNMSSAALLPDVPNDKKTATLVTMQSNLSEQVVNDMLGSVTSQYRQATREDRVQSSVQDTSPKEVVEAAPSPSRVRSKSLQPQGAAVAPQPINESFNRDIGTKTSQTSLDGLIIRPPASVPKVKSSKKTKKASFTAETSFASSHGSIKSVLKVQKTDMIDRAQKQTPPALSFSKSMDMDTSLEEGAKSFKHASSAEMRKVPKSILRSRSTHSSPAAALASAMLSPRREGSSFSKTSNRDRYPSGQNGMLQHQQAEEFDLEGAMDDLGSFLSDWDAEKEKLPAM